MARLVSVWLVFFAAVISPPVVLFRGNVRADEPAAAAKPVGEESAAADDELWSEPGDDRPADARIADLMDTIRQQIDKARAAGKPEQADTWKRQLAALDKQRSGEYAPTKSDRAELHMVGVYEGDYILEKGHKRADGTRVRGNANVYVSHTATPVVLALASYEPVMWDVRVAKGVRLEKVIVSSYYGSDAAAPKGVPVVGARPADAEGGAWYAYRKGDDSFRRAEAELRKATGLDVRTMIGAYAPKTQEFVVGPEGEVWRDERLAADYAALARETTAEQRKALTMKLDETRFEGLTFIGREHPGGGASGFGVFSVRGPLAESIRPIPSRCSRVACDVVSGEFYAVSDHGLSRFKLDAKADGQPALERVVLDVGLPEISWPCGLAIDTRRRRVLLATLGGIGYLYAYDIANRKWSVLGDLANSDLHAMAYDAKNDLIVGFRTEYNQGTRLVKINSKGGVVAELQVQPPIWPIDRPTQDPAPFAHVFGDHVLVVSPKKDAAADDVTGQLTVVDLKTGRAVLGIAQRLQTGNASRARIRAHDAGALRTEQARIRDEIARLTRDAQAVEQRIELLEKKAAAGAAEGDDAKPERPKPDGGNRSPHSPSDAPR